MSKQSLWLAAAALLFAGVAQAAAQGAQADPERPAVDQQEAPAPTAGDDTKAAAGKMTSNEGGQASPADANPVQANGGDCGAN